CQQCGREFVSTHGNIKYCSDSCRREWSLNSSKEAWRQYYYNGGAEIIRERLASEYDPKEHAFNCAECGTYVEPEYGNTRTKYCSDSCAKKSVKRHGRHLRRARKYAARHERFDTIDVLRRDK